MNLLNKKIGVIALGWLGTDLALHLKKNGAIVWGTARNTAKIELLKYECKLHTIFWQNESGISEEMKIALFETDILIINLPPKVFSNQSYSDGLLQFSPYLSPNVKIIFTSSTSVYPNNLKDAKEDFSFLKTEFNPILEAEVALQKVFKNQLTILRLAGLIGEDRHPIHHLIKKERNENPKLPVNLIHKTDVIKIIEQVIRAEFWGETCNVCHPEHPLREKYYHDKAVSLSLNIPKFSNATNFEYGKVVNCDKLKNKLNYKEFVTI